MTKYLAVNRLTPVMPHCEPVHAEQWNLEKQNPNASMNVAS